LVEELEKVYPQIMRKITLEFSTKPAKQQKVAQGQSGFVPALSQWVLECSHAWMENWSLYHLLEGILDAVTVK
jgi:hypothetical protein